MAEKKLSTGQLLSFTLYGCDKVAIVGKNGIGKTRLLREIRQELLSRPDLSVGYMPQNYDEILPLTQSACDFLEQDASPQQVRTLLASLKFSKSEIRHLISDLSGGQKAKLFLAKMVLAKNHVLLLDEPSRHFSPTSQPVLREILRDYPGAILCISHDRRLIEDCFPTVYQLTSDSIKEV